MIRVALLTDQPKFRHEIPALLRREGLMMVGAADQADTLRSKLSGWAPEAIVITDPLSGTDVGALAQQLQAAFPGLAILVLSQSTDPSRIRQLFRRGVHDVLTLPKDLGALPGALREAVAGGGARSRTGKVIALWSPKGGTGTSLLAANLGVQLQTARHLRTLLVDLCGPFGGAGSLLGLTPDRTLSDLFRVMTELTPNHLTQAAVQHSSGLSLLGAPRLPEPLGGLRPEHPAILASLCRELFDVTLLDLPAAWVEPVIAALYASDRLLIIVTPDAPAIKACQAAATLLRQDRGERLSAGLVINRTSRQIELQPREIERMIGLPLVGTIRSDFRLLEPLINTGQALTPTKGKAPPLLGDLSLLAARLA